MSPNLRLIFNLGSKNRKYFRIEGLLSFYSNTKETDRMLSGLIELKP